jgi:hypothetical protein
VTPGPAGSFPSFLDIPRQLYVLVSFPVKPSPTKSIIRIPTKLLIPIKLRTAPDWDGFRQHFTSDAKINGLTLDQFIANSNKTITRYQCSSLLVTEVKASQDSATVTSYFKATAKYKKELMITTVTENGFLVAHFTRGIINLRKGWLIDNMDITIGRKKPDDPFNIIREGLE